MEEIKVRHSEPEDALAIRDIYACKNAYSGTLQLPNPSAHGWVERMANVPANVYSFVAEINGEIVGNLGFEVCSNMRRRHVGSFGMGVKDHYQGKGVGSALLTSIIELADNWLNIMRIELTVYTDNHSAIALYEKFGFVIEGESKAFAFRNGQYVNVYHMARFNIIT
ncbi:MAG: GNAT family N-acetyltransferase [Moritella sp.]|uniref:GNAT family N-acetyltransferase n=1 Tax=Moritella sp. TaxID=78556 RepID=UPI0025FB4CC2|nr:GNAT family N-acetyltransferase [Moritella sp.]NQZ93408.1 GNAT family N-acetyltransferase [Moritella sp.]